MVAGRVGGRGCGEALGGEKLLPRGVPTEVSNVGECVGARRFGRGKE
jgi:hypothetical protein